MSEQNQEFLTNLLDALDQFIVQYSDDQEALAEIKECLEDRLEDVEIYQQPEGEE